MKCPCCDEEMTEVKECEICGEEVHAPCLDRGVCWLCQRDDEAAQERLERAKDAYDSLKEDELVERQARRRHA